ncbi:MAG: hypothetical protein ABR970_17320 [Roseiarcus sp.]|jgi:hypothetical protein
MLNKASLAFIGALTVLPQLAAAETSSRCVDVSVPKQAIIARNGRWIELTSEQWQFMRGIYAMNPQTPAGLPYGDKAVLAQVEGNNGGMVFFIDGDKACTPMPVPVELITMMRDVATDTINHESGGL